MAVSIPDIMTQATHIGMNCCNITLYHCHIIVITLSTFCITLDGGFCVVYILSTAAQHNVTSYITGGPGSASSMGCTACCAPCA